MLAASSLLLGLVSCPAASGMDALPVPRLIQVFTSADSHSNDVALTASNGLRQIIDGRPVVSLAHTGSQSRTFPLLTIVHPATSTARYAVTGEVKYANVEGKAFLEMWTHFPPVRPGQPSPRYFSRTLADSGRMAYLTGSSDWRAFELPFDSTGASGKPVTLELNLVLPGSGTVDIGPFCLVEYPGDWPWSPGIFPGAWWGNRESGWIGGLFGLVYGGAGALVGWLSGRGLARTFVTLSMRILIGIGGLALIVGGFAFFQGQPYAVWYPLVLTGVISLAVLPVVLRQMTRQYAKRELQRIQAADALRG